MSSLHPLSRACAAVGEEVIGDVIAEVALACRGGASHPPRWAEFADTDADALRESPLTASLLALEAEATGACEAQAQRALAGGAFRLNAVPHAAKASDVVVCTNCRQQVAVHRYAPHLEKCMLGKGPGSWEVRREGLKIAF